jgi:hypothetical protein
MTKRHRRVPIPPAKMPIITSLLDHMKDGREFESLVRYKAVNIDVATEIRKSLHEIKAARNRPAICYLANVVNTGIKVSTSIDYNDDLPFSEMISAIPQDQKAIDVILVTPGGSAEQVAKFVDKLRPRFDDVVFILPYMAMSAGTIFAVSGNDIIMGKNSYIGPIDPQVSNKEGFYVPAQAILTLIDSIQERGEVLIKQGQSPLWTDLQILKQLDGKEIGNALTASAYSMELVQGYLYNYKFKNWTNHSNDGRPVTEEDKRERAKEIAVRLCSHAQWKTHSRGISRDVAWDECKIRVIHTESIDNLDRAIRRFWALMYWVFENTAMYKAFISEQYCIFRNDRNLMT